MMQVGRHRESSLERHTVAPAGESSKICRGRALGRTWLAGSTTAFVVATTTTSDNNIKLQHNKTNIASLSAPRGLESARL